MQPVRVSFWAKECWPLKTVSMDADGDALAQCCATFLHSRRTKYCQRVMTAHQPHFEYCGGGGGDCFRECFGAKK
jgi:hypothetical protein